ncbi:MAG: M23 family metallopeptidase [Vicinamibacteria bacterium]|jgi:murein DD-endopeptidase MepM/ murein hydrolase activator NlpD|nr:M23 family metallopeptidase [Vicinamibacteria bacterium]
MANDFFTLIVVPHAKARFRKIQVPLKLARWAGGLAATAVVVFLVVVGRYASMAYEVAEVERLRSENASLLSKNQEYEKHAGQLQAKVEGLERMVAKLGVMAGLETVVPAGPTSAGLGGVLGVEAQAPRTSLPLLGRNLIELERKSGKLEEFYRDQRALLAATPSIWPARGYLSSNFGNRTDPFTGQRDFHAGLDISGPVGTRIIAPADGLVVSAGVAGAYGNAIVLNHGFGVVTRYAHMSRFNVRPGQRVRRGEVIGFMGSTGRSTSTHLHYEVWVRDQAQNPIHYILDEYRSFG